MSQKSFDIKVYDVDKDKRMKKINSTIREPLPKLCQHVLFCSPTNSGKSTIILNLLKDHLAFKWDRIIFFSSTWDFDIYKEFIYIDKENIHRKFDYKDLMKIVQEQETSIEENPRKPLNTLIIFDDMQEYFRTGSILEDFLCKCRHYYITCWVVAQYVHAISKKARQQFTCFLVFPDKINEEDKDVIGETAPIGKKKFLKACDYVTDVIDRTGNKHNFLWINKSLVNKYWLNFKELILLT
ncbi:MAG: hypothetical protein IPM51_12230 [Sphingobacteriaceae bacterium]|nr:hypothetical protein [Sphingobacteriaceae bacterium]